MGSKFEVKNSGIDGKGVFAVQSIQQGELICEMRGEEISIAELKRRYESGQERLTDPFQIKEAHYLDLYEPYLYINHSCNPTAAIVGLNQLVAVRNINKGEEVTYDYSLTEWTDDSVWQGYDD